MTDRELLYVKTIMEEKSISRAALKLYISQPSLSQAVQKIENQIGVKLFHRTAGGLLPTQAGMQYYNTANEILRSYDKMLSTIGNQIRAEERYLVLGTSTSLSVSLISEKYPLFLEKHPEIRFTIIEANYSTVYQQLYDGTIDLAVLHIPTANIQNQFQYQLIRRDTFVVVSNAEAYPFQSAEKKPGYRYPVIDPEELTTRPYLKLMDDSTFNPFIEQHLAQNGLHLEDNIFLSANRLYIANFMAKQTGCFTFSPNYCIPEGIPETCRFQMPHNFFGECNMYAVTNRGNSTRKNSEVDTFIQFLMQIMDKTEGGSQQSELYLNRRIKICIEY